MIEHLLTLGKYAAAAEALLKLLELLAPFAGKVLTESSKLIVEYEHLIHSHLAFNEAPRPPQGYNSYGGTGERELDYTYVAYFDDSKTVKYSEALELYELKYDLGMKVRERDFDEILKVAERAFVLIEALYSAHDAVV